MSFCSPTYDAFMVRHVSDFIKPPIDIVIDLVSAGNGITLEIEKVSLNGPKQVGERTSVKIDGVSLVGTKVSQTVGIALANVIYHPN